MSITDLLYRAQSCNATAFIGDHYAISHFDEIAHKTQVRTLIHVRTDDNATLSASKVDFNSILGDDRKSGKFEPAEQTKSTDLAMLCKTNANFSGGNVQVKLTSTDPPDFTSGTTGKAKMVILNQTWTLGHIMSGEWYGLKPGQRECIVWENTLKEGVTDHVSGLTVFANLADLGWAKAAFATFGAVSSSICLLNLEHCLRRD